MSIPFSLLADDMPIRRSNRYVGLPHYELAYRVSGVGAMLIKDDKVDQWIGRMPLGGEVAVEFLPTGRWNCLQQWNNASIGVAAKVLHMGNDKMLGYVIGTYGYINFPFYTSKHFVIGIRPAVGLAFATKTYRNTLPANIAPYTKAEGVANWSIGSVVNAYLGLELYMDFPITYGWDITVNGGWTHVSNGSVMHPNSGYNMASASVGVRFTPGIYNMYAKHFGYRPPKTRVPHRLYEDVDKPWAVEVSATGGIKQNYYGDNRNGQLFFGAASLKAAAYWVPLSIFRIGGGVDAFYDGYYSAVNAEYSTQNPDAPITHFGKTYLKESNVWNCFRIGLSVQPELIIGRLTAGIHVGFYLYDPVKNLEPKDVAKAADQAGTPLSRGIFYQYDFTKASNYQDGWLYMQFVLKYHVLEHLFVQLGLKTHGVRAEFIDAGLGVAF